jgi:hypothetical protein
MPSLNNGATRWRRAESTAAANVSGATKNKAAVSLPRSWLSVVGEVRYRSTPRPTGPRMDVAAIPSANAARTNASA